MYSILSTKVPFINHILHLKIYLPMSVDNADLLHYSMALTTFSVIIIQQYEHASLMFLSLPNPSTEFQTAFLQIPMEYWTSAWHCLYVIPATDERYISYWDAKNRLDTPMKCRPGLLLSHHKELQSLVHVTGCLE